ncbi:MAG TPA: hypothetical protein VD866_02450 [Urbifossiella sp.]|nr:hypothetical protein [Urbifossiella sp.]
MDYDPDTRYSHWLKQFVVTAGVQWMADQAGAHWLVDAIASHQPNPKARAEEFQVWTLKVNPDRSALLTMTDGNTDMPIIQQRIEWTDYPEPTAELYLVQTPGHLGTLMLPVEY